MTILPIAQADWKRGWVAVRERVQSAGDNVWIQLGIKLFVAAWKWAQPKFLHASNDELFERCWTIRVNTTLRPSILHLGLSIRGTEWWPIQIVGKPPC
jgi:hypothetical protein